MITHALAGKPLPVYGDGAQVRDWLYVRDHCSAIRAVLAGGRVGETYNVGGGNQRTNLEVVNTLCALLDELVPTPPSPPLAAHPLRHRSPRPRPPLRHRRPQARARTRLARRRILRNRPPQNRRRGTSRTRPGSKTSPAAPTSTGSTRTTAPAPPPRCPR